MKYYIFVFIFLVASICNTYSCDILSPRLELNKAVSRVVYESDSSHIPQIVASQAVTILKKPDWVLINAPSKVGTTYYYSLEVVKNKAPSQFKLQIREGGRQLELDLKLMVKDPSPNRKLTPFEKSCGRIPYSSIVYQ